MPLLDACLAFALTMLSLATIATLATEIFLRVVKARASGLRMMLENLAEQELKPWVQDRLRNVDWAVVKENCLTTLQASPLASLTNTTKLNRFAKWAAKKFGLLRLNSMTFDEFLKRLPETDLGQHVAALAETEREKLFQRLAHRYEEFGDAVTDLFTRYAQIISLLVGVALAFLMNVDAYRIFEAYQRDASLRGRVIQNADQTVAQWQKVEKQLTDLQDGSAQAAEKTLSDVKQQVNDLATQWKALNTVGLPIGYDYFPKNTSVATEKTKWYYWFAVGWLYVSWALCVLLSGLLIGLGGPFWFNIVNKLMQVTQVFRGGGGGDAGNGGGGGEVRVARTAARATPISANQLFMLFATRETHPAATETATAMGTAQAATATQATVGAQTAAAVQATGAAQAAAGAPEKIAIDDAGQAVGSSSQT